MSCAEGKNSAPMIYFNTLSGQSQRVRANWVSRAERPRPEMWSSLVERPWDDYSQTPRIALRYGCFVEGVVERGVRVKSTVG